MLPDRSFSELFDADSDPITQTRARVVPVERRAAGRVAFEADVVVATGSQFFSGISSDLSTSGIFIATHRAADVGASVTLEFALPEAQVLARGVVRWVRAGGDGVVPGLGVRFEDLSDVDREHIAKYCDSRPRLFACDDVKAAIGSN